MVTDTVHDAAASVVLAAGPMDVELFARQLRRRCKGFQITDEFLTQLVWESNVLVGLPDGRIDHLLRVLDGMVLTQRVRAPLLDRRDLWTNIAVQPFVVLLLMRDLPLATGGHISCAAHNLDALVGPEGWLPDVPVFSLIALELHEGRISVRPVDNDELPDLAQQQRAREVVARHYRKERWWRNEDDLESRPGELVRALTLARLEDPGFLTTPLPPLDELLYDPLEQEVDRHHWPTSPPASRARP